MISFTRSKGGLRCGRANPSATTTLILPWRSPASQCLCSSISWWNGGKRKVSWLPFLSTCELKSMTCGQFVRGGKTLPLHDDDDLLSATPTLLVPRVTYATHSPSTKTLTSNSEVSSGCNRLSIKRLTCGGSQLCIDTRKGLSAGRLGMKVVRTGK
jgi:hypothetical protein